MSTSDEDFAKALKLHEAELAPEAELAYRKILEVDPEHTVTLHMLGVLVAQTGRVEEGIKILREATERDPGNSQARAKAISEKPCDKRTR